MNHNGQQITHNTYEDPEIIDAYIKRNATQPKQKKLITTFVKTISGKKVLDLGCGPGHDSYIFSDFGFEVVGLDLSNEMIKRAKNLHNTKNQPKFIVGDMTNLHDYFTQNEFDAIWASASMLHIPLTDITKTIQEVTYVAKNRAKIYIGLKGGKKVDTFLVDENKYGKAMQREFTLWTKTEFIKMVKPYGWELDKFISRDGSLFMGKPTKWLNFFFTIKK